MSGSGVSELQSSRQEICIVAPGSWFCVERELGLGAEHMKWGEASDMAGQGLGCGMDLLGFRTKARL